MGDKRILLSKIPDTTTATNFSERFRAFYPKEIAIDKDGNNLVAADVVVPFNPNDGKCVMPTIIVDGTTNTIVAKLDGLASDMANGKTVLIANASQFVKKDSLSEAVRTPTTWKWAACTTVAATDVWTPAGGKKFRVMGGVIWPSAGLAAAGVETIDLQEETLGTFGLKFQTYCPIAASVAAQAPLPFTLPGNGYLATTADKKLQVVLGTAATAGAISVSVWGTEE